MTDLEQLLAPIVAKCCAASLRKTPNAGDASIDIFEETLLRMAGIKTKPTFCLFNGEDNADFVRVQYMGLTADDVRQFATFMKLLPEDVTLFDYENRVIFTIPAKRMEEEIVPAFEKELLTYREKSPEILKPYINPVVALMGIMGAMNSVTQELEDEACKKEFQTFETNMAITYMPGISEQGLTPQGFSYESALACKKELETFCNKHPDLNNNEEIKKGLKDLNNFLDLFLLAIKPAANLQCPRIGKFFDEHATRDKNIEPDCAQKFSVR